MNVVESLSGQLTMSLFTDHSSDQQLAEHLEDKILPRKAWRLSYNEMPTGVDVCNCMHHGGPYPATSLPVGLGASSVGTHVEVISRFLQNVSIQNKPRFN